MSARIVRVTPPSTNSRSRSITLETGQSDREANMWRFAHEALALLEQVVRSG